MNHRDDHDVFYALQFRVQKVIDELESGVEVGIGCDVRTFGAVVAAARQSGVTCEAADLESVEALWEKGSALLDEGCPFVVDRASDEDLEALRALQRLLERLQPLARKLARQCEHGIKWALINPAHPQGPTILANNDTGIYDDPWEALADLAEAQREHDNPDMYLARVIDALPIPTERTLSDQELVQADACFQYVCDMIRLHKIPPRHILFGSTLARWLSGKSVIVASSIPRSAAGSANFEVCRITSRGSGR
jgi:hypothetical protein